MQLSARPELLGCLRLAPSGSNGGTSSCPSRRRESNRKRVIGKKKTNKHMSDSGCESYSWKWFFSFLRVLCSVDMHTTNSSLNTWRMEGIPLASCSRSDSCHTVAPRSREASLLRLCGSEWHGDERRQRRQEFREPLGHWWCDVTACHYDVGDLRYVCSGTA